MNDWKNSHYLSLSSQKRDGNWVNTPVWHAKEDNIFYIFSEGKAGKVKRLRNFTDAKICPCDILGKLQGEWQNVSAEILEGPENKNQAYSALLSKYGWQIRLLDLGSTIAGKKNKRAFIKLTL